MHTAATHDEHHTHSIQPRSFSTGDGRQHAHECKKGSTSAAHLIIMKENAYKEYNECTKALIERMMPSNLTISSEAINVFQHGMAHIISTICHICTSTNVTAANVSEAFVSFQQNACSQQILNLTLDKTTPTSQETPSNGIGQKRTRSGNDVDGGNQRKRRKIDTDHSKDTNGHEMAVNIKAMIDNYESVMDGKQMDLKKEIETLKKSINDVRDKAKLLCDKARKQLLSETTKCNNLQQKVNKLESQNQKLKRKQKKLTMVLKPLIKELSDSEEEAPVDRDKS
eukprot:1136719_1